MNKWYLFGVGTFFLLLGCAAGYLYADRLNEKLFTNSYSAGLMNDAIFAMKIHEKLKDGEEDEAIAFLTKWIESLKFEAEGWIADESIDQDEAFFIATLEYIEKYENGTKFKDL